MGRRKKWKDGSYEEQKDKGNRRGGWEEGRGRKKEGMGRKRVT